MLFVLDKNKFNKNIQSDLFAWAKPFTIRKFFEYCSLLYFLFIFCHLNVIYPEIWSPIRILI